MTGTATANPAAGGWMAQKKASSVGVSGAVRTAGLRLSAAALKTS